MWGLTSKRSLDATSTVMAGHCQNCNLQATELGRAKEEGGAEEGGEVMCMQRKPQQDRETMKHMD